jgi:hypothetical protein
VNGFYLVMCKHPGSDGGWYPSLLPQPTQTRAVAEHRADEIRRHNKYPVKVVSASAAAFADELVSLARDVLHQLSTDSDLSLITGAQTYVQLERATRELLLEVDATLPELGPT